MNRWVRYPRWDAEINSQDSLRAPLCSSCLREKRGRYLSAKGERREAKRERREESHTDFSCCPRPVASSIKHGKNQVELFFFACLLSPSNPTLEWLQRYISIFFMLSLLFFFHTARGLVTGRDQDSEKSIKYYMWSMVVLLTNSFLEATLIVPSSAAQTYQQRCLRLHNHSTTKFRVWTSHDFSTWWLMAWFGVIVYISCFVFAQDPVLFILPAWHPPQIWLQLFQSQAREGI